MFAGTRLLGKEFDLHRDGPRLLPLLCPEPPSNPFRQETGSQLRSDACALEAAAVGLLKLVDQSPRETIAFTAEMVSLASDTKRTILHFGASLGFEQFLQELMARGADPDQRDNTGCTALHFAALFGHIGCTHLLLHEGADADIVNAEGDTALNIALKSNRHAIVELLKAYMAVEADVADSSGEREDGDLEAHMPHEKVALELDNSCAANSISRSGADTAEITLR